MTTHLAQAQDHFKESDDMDANFKIFLHPEYFLWFSNLIWNEIVTSLAMIHAFS